MNSSDSSLDIKVNMDKIQSDPGVTLTIRLIMQSKEVGSIIGKGGEIVKRFREESGAKINISDGSCSERIVTVTGTTSAIYKAFLLICKKFEDFVENGSGGSRPPITLRLIVPASQCGSLIGRGGCKIKEIREECRASIQVASDMLPNSTERAVTVTGTGEAITQCIYHICVVMLECPPKGVTIPYRPKPQVTGPVILAGGQAYTIQGNYAVPAHGGDVSSAPPAFTGLLGPPGPSLLANALMDPLTKNAHLQAALPPTNILPPATAYEIGKLGGGPLAGLAALGLSGLGAPTNAAGINPAALAAIAGSQLRGNSTPAPNNRITQQNSNSHQTHELTVPNDLIGCIIGKGGSKIAEIRQISGAMIRISNCEEREGGSTDRTISISGNPDAVALAQYLINMSVELQKQNLESQNPSNPGGGVSSIATSSSATPSASTTPSPLAGAIPLAQLLAKPGALNALSSLSALSGLTDLLGGDFSNHNTGNGPPIQITGVHQSKRNYSSRSRSPNQDGGKLRNDRNERSKFAPY